MKTLIAIPCMETLPVDFVKSLLYMSKGENPTVYFSPGSLVHDSRNLISLYAIQNEFDQVLWLDSDMVVPPDALLKLQAHDLEMVTGLYVKRYLPTEPVLYKTIEEPARNENGLLEKRIDAYTDFPSGKLFRVAGCGFGCVLTKTSLLKKVWDNFGPAFSMYPWAGEDISFCYRVKQLGLPIFCDSSVSCGHIGKHIFTENDLQRGEENAQD